MKDKVIIFFTRIPVWGRTKTRLEPFLSKEECVELQTNFIKDIYRTIKNTGIDIIVNYSIDGELKILEKILDESPRFLRQEGEGLGEKMNHAIEFGLKEYKNVVLIGSDLPLIREEDLYLAFHILEEKDLVISPTFDGGYYLIGMKDENQSIFQIEYSSKFVFDETLKGIESLGKSYGVGNIQIDIDDKNDFLSLFEILKREKEVRCENTYLYMNKIVRERDLYENA